MNRGRFGSLQWARGRFVDPAGVPGRNHSQDICLNRVSNLNTPCYRVRTARWASSRPPPGSTRCTEDPLPARLGMKCPPCCLCAVLRSVRHYVSLSGRIRFPVALAGAADSYTFHGSLPGARRFPADCRRPRAGLVDR